MRFRDYKNWGCINWMRADHQLHFHKDSTCLSQLVFSSYPQSLPTPSPRGSLFIPIKISPAQIHFNLASNETGSGILRQIEPNCGRMNQLLNSHPSCIIFLCVLYLLLFRTSRHFCTPTNTGIARRRTQESEPLEVGFNLGAFGCNFNVIENGGQIIGTM